MIFAVAVIDASLGACLGLVVAALLFMARENSPTERGL